jgi:hypothetical protein
MTRGKQRWDLASSFFSAKEEYKFKDMKGALKLVGRERIY